MNGLLLINLGTPDATGDKPTPKEVARYLREFLMDPYVIDIPVISRWLLVNLIIAPFRKYKSARAYASIWTTEGSPLLCNHQALGRKVATELKDKAVIVATAMRYGSPSIRSRLEELRAKGATSLTVLPLYPQYAESSTRSSLEKVRTELAKMRWAPPLKEISSFFADPAHTEAWREVIAAEAGSLADTHVLFSFHGLPERHLTKIDSTGTCVRDGDYSCCQSAGSCPALATCYRAQSVVTASKIAAALGLAATDWSYSFQSRLGRTPWIRPFTDEEIPRLGGALPALGKKRLVVVTPSFVADCLETIEEIGDRGRSLFDAARNDAAIEFRRISCLNDRPTWVRAVCSIAGANSQ